MTARTLYECSHARVKGIFIYCARGHPLSRKSKPGNGHIDIQRLARGEALALVSCRRCPDFDCIGAPVPPEERGWLDKKVVSKS
jgi:hypothetical protein